MDLTKWFSEPKETIEEAQQLHNPGILQFDPAAVYRRSDGKYVMALLRRSEWPPHKTAAEMKELLEFEMVSICDPLFGIWKAYQKEGISTDLSK